MQRQDIENLAENIANKVCDKQIPIIEKLVDAKLQIHAATCPKGKCGETAKAFKVIIAFIITVGKWFIK